MKPLYLAEIAELTSSAEEGSATPMTPVPPPNAPKPPNTGLKLLTKSPALPILISSGRGPAVPNVFSGSAVSAPKTVCEQPPVTVEVACGLEPTRNGWVAKVTSDP